MNKKEQLAFQEKIACEIASQYQCTCNIEQLTDDKLYESVIKLLNKQEIPLEVAVATLKFLIHNLYFQEIIEEIELKKAS
jgi:hypothetical protein